MLRNYFNTALRTLLRNKFFSLINVLGLSLGLTCCMLIMLYTRDEISFDGFHENKDQLYRLTVDVRRNATGEVDKIGVSGDVHGPAFKQEIPEIREVVRVKNDFFIIKSKGQSFSQEVLFVDDNFFEAFSFSLSAGNADQVLSGVNSVVLTDEAALKFFGTTDVVGKTLEMEISGKFEPLTVSGIARKPPQNSSIKFAVLLPYALKEKIEPDPEWINLMVSTFVQLQPGSNLSAVEAKMNKVFASKAENQIKEAKEKFGFNNSYDFGLQPLPAMHLSTDYPVDHPSLKDGSKPIYSYILTGIALFILLIACINFVNLTVAQSLKRSKEIGIRKVIGGDRGQLIIQFLGESFMLSLLAFGLALLLLKLTLPLFNQLANKELRLLYLLDGTLILGYLGLFLLTGLAAGFYPALVLSGFDPVQSLYKRTAFAGKNYLAKILVVIQFSLATFLIIATLFVYAQFVFLTQTKLGYNDENLVIVNLMGLDDRRLTPLFNAELAKEPTVQAVATKSLGGMITEVQANGKKVEFQYEHIDTKFLPTLQIPLTAGRNFSADLPSDSTQAVLVNETFVKEAGWKNPVGQNLQMIWNNRKLTIVGVVKDYHFASLKHKIMPQVFTMEPELRYGQLLIKVRPNNIPQTIKSIEKIYHRLVPFRPFEYSFQEDINARQYEAEAKWKQIIGYAAILSIFISAIGLLGLTILSIERRTKEIGIRKVLGAAEWQLVTLLSRDFMRLVGLAFLVAIPLAYYAVKEWLTTFAYRIDLGWQLFALAGTLSLLVALLTISYQSIKAALANPVKSLRSE